MPQEPRDIIDRLIVALDLKTQAQLAASLEIRPQSIVSALNRGEVPEAWLYRVAYRTGRSIEWLKTGKGPAWHGALLAEPPAPAYGDKSQPEMWQRVSQAWAHMDADERGLLLRCVEILNGSEHDLREHLIAQVKLIDEMAQARRTKRARPKRP
ncbi:MAG: bacteriophage CI repressor [Nitrospira sp.]|nr:bacteriophage CI repressor [Nitrospira sp.]